MSHCVDCLSVAVGAGHPGPGFFLSDNFFQCKFYSWVQCSREHWTHETFALRFILGANGTIGPSAPFFWGYFNEINFNIS